MENNYWKNMIAELIDYTFPHPWRPIDVFLDLIRLKFIDLNPVTGVVTQLRNFKHGGQLEKPVIIHPVRRKNGYYYLQIEVGGFNANEHRTPRLRVTQFDFIVSFAVQPMDRFRPGWRSIIRIA